jgi:hypothetical protein
VEHLFDVHPLEHVAARVTPQQRDAGERDERQREHRVLGDAPHDDRPVGAHEVLDDREDQPAEPEREHEHERVEVRGPLLRVPQVLVFGERTTRARQQEPEREAGHREHGTDHRQLRPATGGLDLDLLGLEVGDLLVVRAHWFPPWPAGPAWSAAGFSAGPGALATGAAPQCWSLP